MQADLVTSALAVVEPAALAVADTGHIRSPGHRGTTDAVNLGSAAVRSIHENTFPGLPVEDHAEACTGSHVRCRDLD